MARKPLLCLLGWHSWYIDSAIFCSAERCNRCPAVKDASAFRSLESERSIFEAAAAGQRTPLSPLLDLLCRENLDQAQTDP
jgi:hypothetical protein